MSVTADPLEAVTARQLELLALYASGEDIPTIAKMKYLSPYTVRNILTRARENVGARSLTHLCVVLVDSGMLARNGNGYKPVQDERVVGD